MACQEHSSPRGLVDQVQVEVVEAEAGQRLLEGFPWRRPRRCRWTHSLVVTNSSSRDAAVGDGPADGLFVLVRLGGVEVAVADGEGVGDGLLGLIGEDLEDAEPQDRRLDAIVEVTWRLWSDTVSELLSWLLASGSLRLAAPEGPGGAACGGGGLLVRSPGQEQAKHKTASVWEALSLPGSPGLRRGEHGRSLVDVDNRNDIRQFLTSRRAKITRAGRPAHLRQQPARSRPAPGGGGAAGRGQRRLLHPPGAGQPRRGLEIVLDALAQALQLDEAERGHLFDLARAANTTARPRRRPAPSGSGRVCSASWTRCPMRRRMCAMAAATSWPPTASATLYSELYIDPVRPANVAGSCSSAPAPRSSFPTGRAPPTTWWPACALRPAAAPMTGRCRT